MRAAYEISPEQPEGTGAARPASPSPPRTESETAVSLRQLSLSYGSGKQRRQVLGGIDLEIAAGEFVCVLGASGCGKTSLLRVIAGYERPEAGEVALFGKPHSGPRSEVGVVFQHANLFPWLTAAGNVAFGLKMAGIPKRERLERAEGWLAEVGLAGSGRLLPHQLSGGMKQRTAIARSMITEPELLLMDEPFGALDAITREGLQVLLRQLAEQTRRTIVFITHDVDEALFLSSRILVMSGRPGGIAADMPNPLAAHSRGSTPMRQLPGYVKLREQLVARLK